MRARIAAMALIAGAMVFAMSIGRANAKSDKESCKSTTMDVTNSNVDGTECETDVTGSGPNKATATASKQGNAFAEAEDTSTASAKATKNSQSTAVVVAGEGSATSSGDMADADVLVEDGGKGTAKATGENSDAVADSDNGAGFTDATATGGGVANAQVITAGGGNAVATAKELGIADAVVELTGGGTAEATSSGTSAFASSLATNDCTSVTNAKGNGSEAEAECMTSGSTVTSSATKGSLAVGSDTAPPVCMPKNGGKAKVRSPMGNCG